RPRSAAAKRQLFERDMNLDNGLGDIGLPLKETSRSAQSRRALEKDNLGASIVEIHIPLEKLTLRCRASRPISRDAREYQPIPRPGRIAWGSHRSFGYRL
ncbi:MAG: hypothetical protein ACLPKH_13110, partial [Rhodomicrobium sp.]